MIIGLAGKAGSGKDTVADYLVANYGFEKISFAKPLKDMLSAAGFPEPTNRDDKEKPINGFNFSWRYMAQTLGTEWGRNCLGQDIWVQIAMRNLDTNKNYVFSDVRFENEADAIRKAGGIVIHLLGRKSDLGSNGEHISEKPLVQIGKDIMLLNQNSKQHLFTTIDCFMESINISKSESDNSKHFSLF